MDWNRVFDVVISGLRPEHVAPDFIIQATYTDRHGVEHTVTGIELAFFMANPTRFQTREARVVFDVRKIRRVMYDQVMDFFLDLNERIARKK